MTQQPIFILQEGSQRTVGRDAQRNNIMAAKLVAETVRTTLGPKGMDKMLVDSTGDIVVTNDGVTILEEMQIEHPAAKMIVEVAKTQEAEVGDGTTTAVILAGELLKNAEALLDKNVHPTVIVKGYRIASEKSQEILNNMATKISKNDADVLKKISMTAMTGKGAEYSKELLGNLTVNAVQMVSEENDSKILVDLDNIKIEKKVGGGVDDSQIIRGIVIDKERVHSQMPVKVKNAKVALVDAALEVKNTEIDAKIQITSPDQLEGFLEQEERMIRKMVDKVVNSGANVLICQKGIDDLGQHLLAKKGIYACRRVKKSDMDKLVKATGGKLVSNLDDLSREDLGEAGVVREVKVGEDQYTYVEDCKNPKAVTIFVRGGTSHVIDEVERAVKDALGDVTSALVSGKVVAGGGAPEVELAKELRLFANSLKGREQLAVLAFADAVEVVPRTLAENAGLDPIDMLTAMKAEHDNGNKSAGLDVFSGKVVDAWRTGVIEPLKIKTQAVQSASEVTNLILRIDDVIAAGSLDKGSKMPQMPPMEGM
ncbi:MAG: TCP-1/cpn60 chaperonin family protein [Candidatus Woesearchaeota archaeon]|nr:MAG: TCP-1/cpn60 chaperonin family protein [Candidatus Woesearchaeota archaeon]